MHKVILAILAAGVSNFALADWVKLIATDKFTVYAEASTIQKAKTTATMWYVIDYKAPQHFTMNGIDAHFLSTKGRDEFDCKGGRQRQLVIAGYSREMGRGHVVLTDSTQSEWIRVSKTGAEVMWKFACGKR